jgi:hypothetical protein
MHRVEATLLQLLPQHDRARLDQDVVEGMPPDHGSESSSSFTVFSRKP